MSSYLRKVLELYLKPERKCIPRSSLGQHRLKDRKILEEIADFAKAHDVVLEIGGGEGDLTEIISSKSKLVISFEVDRRYADVILKRVNKAVVILSDFLRVDIHQIVSYVVNVPRSCEVFFKGVTEEELKYVLSCGKYRIVSNIPFYISSQLIHKLILESFFVESVHILVQREFARKLVAQPGSDLYSAISSLTQLFYEIKIEFDIPPWKFVPRPEVWGSFISLYPRYPQSQALMFFDTGDIERSKDIIAKFINFVYDIFRGRKRLYQGKRVYKMSPEEMFENFKMSVKKFYL